MEKSDNNDNYLNKGQNKDLNKDKVVEINRISNARKEGLTKGVLITAIIGCILLMVSVILVYSSYKGNQREQLAQIAQMDQQKYSLSKQITERDSLINDWLLTFDQIENNLIAIKQKEHLITLKSSDSEVSKNNKQQVIDDIKYINTLLDENKKKIASLSAQLKKSGGTITNLENKIMALETSIKQYENDIAYLKTGLVKKDFEIGELNTKMTALDLTIEQQDARISRQTHSLNQAYLASGTFKDLKGKGIVYREGGFLGLGRKETLLENFADTVFEKIDVTETKTIPVNSRNAKLISSHPESSYEMIHEGKNKIAYIEIKDPEQFWKISKYAVVEIIR